MVGSPLSGILGVRQLVPSQVPDGSLPGMVPADPTPPTPGATLSQALCQSQVFSANLNKPEAQSRTATCQDHTKRQGLKASPVSTRPGLPFQCH